MLLGAAMQLELVAKAPEVETFPQIAAEEKHLYFRIGLTFLFSSLIWCYLGNLKGLAAVLVENSFFSFFSV